ncbi:MAG: hypothetical protein ACRD1Y_14220 [Terriglobales bacterium]
MNGAPLTGDAAAYLPPGLFPLPLDLKGPATVTFSENPASQGARGRYEAAVQAAQTSAQRNAAHLEARVAFEAAARQVLRKYVDSWLLAGRDWSTWAARNPAISDALRLTLARLQFFLYGFGVGTKGVGRPKIRPALRCGVGMDFRSDKERTETVAAYFFLGILLSPERDRVGKCERGGCGRYFFSRQRLNDRFIKRRFCSRSCKGERNTRERRAALRAQKLADAAAALKRLPASRIADWKRWVASNAAGGLTPCWLTRAANRGDLKPPSPPKGDADA